MILVSLFISGGIVQVIVNSIENWIYITLLTCGAASSFVTGLLMLFDAVRYKIEDDIIEIFHTNKLSEKGNIKNKKTSSKTRSQIQSLAEDCKRLRPESMKNSEAAKNE